MVGTNQMTVLSKLTKTARKQFIREALKSGVFDRDNMKTVLRCSDRTIRRYLNEIAFEDAEQNPETVHVLRNVCTIKLINKAVNGKLSNHDMLTVVLAGEPKRIESLNMNLNKTETKVEFNVNELLAQYEDLFEEATILENCAPEPLHPTQTNSKAGSVPPT